MNTVARFFRSLYWAERIGYGLVILAMLLFCIAVMAQPDPLGLLGELVFGPDRLR